MYMNEKNYKRFTSFYNMVVKNMDDNDMQLLFQILEDSFPKLLANKAKSLGIEKTNKA